MNAFPSYFHLYAQGERGGKLKLLVERVIKMKPGEPVIDLDTYLILVSSQSHSLLLP